MRQHLVRSFRIGELIRRSGCEQYTVGTGGLRWKQHGENIAERLLEKSLILRREDVADLLGCVGCLARRSEASLIQSRNWCRCSLGS